MTANTMVRLDESCENFGKDNGLIHEAVVTGRKVGAGQNFWAKLAHDEELFEKVVALVAGNGIIASISAVIVNYKPTPSQIRAREIMGKNYLGIEEVVRQFGAAYTEEQLALLAEIPFSEVVKFRNKASDDMKFWREAMALAGRKTYAEPSSPGNVSRG